MKDGNVFQLSGGSCELYVNRPQLGELTVRISNKSISGAASNSRFNFIKIKNDKLYISYEDGTFGMWDIIKVWDNLREFVQETGLQHLNNGGYQ